MNAMSMMLGVFLLLMLFSLFSQAGKHEIKWIVSLGNNQHEITTTVVTDDVNHQQTITHSMSSPLPVELMPEHYKQITGPLIAQALSVGEGGSDESAGSTDVSLQARVSQIVSQHSKQAAPMVYQEILNRGVILKKHHEISKSAHSFCIMTGDDSYTKGE